MKRIAGMTLLELIAAVAISSVVIMTLMSLYHGTLNTRQQVSGSVETMDRLRGIVSLMASDLEQMHVYDDRAYLLVEDLMVDVGVSDSGPTTGGGRITQRPATRLAFPTLTSVRVSEEKRSYPGPIEVAYLIGRDYNNPGRMALFRRELSISINRQETAFRDSTQGFVLLADNLEDFRLEFLPAEATAAPAEAVSRPSSAVAMEDVWQKAWQRRFIRSDVQQEAIPRAVKVHLTAAPEGGRGAPASVEYIIRLPQPNAALEMRTQDLSEAMGINEASAATTTR